MLRYVDYKFKIKMSFSLQKVRQVAIKDGSKCHFIDYFPLLC